MRGKMATVEVKPLPVADVSLRDMLKKASTGSGANLESAIGQNMRNRPAADTADDRG